MEYFDGFEGRVESQIQNGEVNARWEIIKHGDSFKKSGWYPCRQEEDDSWRGMQVRRRDLRIFFFFFIAVFSGRYLGLFIHTHGKGSV